MVQNMRSSDYTSEYFINVLKDLSAIEIVKYREFDSPEINVKFAYWSFIEEIIFAVLSIELSSTTITSKFG